MISAKSAMFKYVERGSCDTVVLIPGWGTDYRIFDSLDLRFNYLLPLDFSPFAFEERLLIELEKNSLKRVSLFGWSLGGFTAADFAYKYSSLVNELILVSIRRKYSFQELAAIRSQLIRSKEGCLRSFYSRCFFRKEELFYSNSSLLENYREELDLNYLLEGLDYLEAREIRPGSLERVENITIIHGDQDTVAPIQEARDIKESLPRAGFISIQGAGHLPFLRKDFGQYAGS